MPDVIVIGTGGIGSAVIHELSAKGVDVLGIDQYPAAHDRGSSHGATRMIRRSYFEHPNYIPLLTDAYDLWRQLSDSHDTPLLHLPGLLYLGSPDSPVLTGVCQSADDYRIPLEKLTSKEAADRFRGFAAPAEYQALFEPDAGFLLVEDCVRTFLQRAVSRGARLQHGETVRTWSATERGVTVETDHDRYHADRLVITAGSWSAGLLKGCLPSLNVLRKHMHWFPSRGQELQTPQAPCFFMEAFDGCFYGFPDFDGNGVKVAEHSGGTEVHDPRQESRAMEPLDNERIDQFVSHHLPGVEKNRRRHVVCYYTMSPDEQFILDRHPAHTNVVFAAGLSGHGFKFAPTLGRILAHMALNEPVAFDIDFLSLNRQGLR